MQDQEDVRLSLFASVTVRLCDNIGSQGRIDTPLIRTRYCTINKGKNKRKMSGDEVLIYNVDQNKGIVPNSEIPLLGRLVVHQTKAFILHLCQQDLIHVARPEFNVDVSVVLGTCLFD